MCFYVFLLKHSHLQNSTSLMYPAVLYSFPSVTPATNVRLLVSWLSLVLQAEHTEPKIWSWELHLRENTQLLSFWAWVTSLRVCLIFSISIALLTNLIFLYNRVVPISCMHHSSLTYLPLCTFRLDSLSTPCEHYSNEHGYLSASIVGYKVTWVYMQRWYNWALQQINFYIFEKLLDSVPKWLQYFALPQAI